VYAEIWEAMKESQNEQDERLKSIQRTLVNHAVAMYEGECRGRTGNELNHCGIFVRNLMSWCVSEEEILGRVRPEHVEEAKQHILSSRGMPKRLPCLLMGPSKRADDTSGWLLPPYAPDPSGTGMYFKEAFDHRYSTQSTTQSSQP
jgi:hypothetical protein